MSWFKHYAGRNVNYGELARKQAEISAKNAELAYERRRRLDEPYRVAADKIVTALAESKLPASEFAKVLRRAEEEAMRKARIVMPTDKEERQ